MRVFTLLLGVVFWSACVPSTESDRGRIPEQNNADGGNSDTGQEIHDSGVLDAGTSDSGIVPDGGTTDSGVVSDGGTTDSGSMDAGSTDSGPIDSGNVDSGVQMDGGIVVPTGQRSETPFRTRHIYSQLQAWSWDGRFFLTVDLDTDEGVVYDAVTWQERARMGRGGHRWIQGSHEVLMFDDVQGARLFGFDVDTQQEREIMSLGHPGLRIGRSHEDTDRSGTWVAVYIDVATSGGPRVVTANLQTGQVGADISISSIGCGFEPDWVGVDPTGQFLLIQSVADGTGNCQGLRAYDIQTGADLRSITDHHNHGTSGLGPTGRPYFLSTELSHPDDNGSPGIYRYWIDDGTREVVGPPLDWGALEHVSCLAGAGEPCYASASNQFSTPYTGQVWRVDFSGQRTILEPHNATDSCDYWGQPHATAGPLGRYAFVTHGGACNQIRSVVVQ